MKIIQKNQYRFDRITVFVVLRSYHGATITHSRQDTHFRIILHSTIEIYRIISGECLMDVQSETLHCTKGDFIMILPNIVHSFYLNKKSDCTFKHVHFDPNMFSNIILENEGVYPITLMHAVLFSSQFYYRFSADDVIDSTLDKLISLYPDSDGLFPAANINISLINLMLYILDHTKPAHHFSNPQLQNSYVAYTLNYIAEHYTEKIIQEDIASQLHISVRYLSKLFKAHIGITLSSYINVYRINHSISLMQNTKLSLTEIALQSGFTNSQHYSKVFRDCVNTTPSTISQVYIDPHMPKRHVLKYKTGMLVHFDRPMHHIINMISFNDFYFLFRTLQPTVRRR